MKKKILILAFAGILVGTFVPMLIFAQGAPDSCTIRINPNSVLGTGATCPAAGQTADYGKDFGTAANPVNGATCCLFSTILYATRWLSTFIGVVLVLLIIMGAFDIVTSGGDAEKIGKGRDYIIYALAGMAVALLAFGLPYIIKLIMGF